MTTQSEHRGTVTVFGAGVTGMTAAHELAVRGFAVTVVEATRAPGPVPNKDQLQVGGLAASQYDRGQLARPFPTESDDTTDEAPKDLLLYGEHGYRFFPSYYRHLFDSMQRTPVYDADGKPTRFSTFDNVQPCSTQATINTKHHPLMVVPRDPINSPLEGDLESLMTKSGYSPVDMLVMTERLLQFMASSPERRKIYEELSSYDFFVGIDEPGAPATITYSDDVEHQLKEMPKVLVAFDGKYGDARTNLNNWVQMMFNQMVELPKTDGILNGPTSTAWLDHWRCLLVNLDVTFVSGELETLVVDSPDKEERLVPTIRPVGRATKAVKEAIAAAEAADYFVVAIDVAAAETVTRDLPQVGVPGQLDGYTTTTPPADPPNEPGYWRDRARAENERDRRDPYTQAGLQPWDRLQYFSGVQFYFEAEFDLLIGRVYFGETDWGLSSVSQTPFWSDRPTVAANGYASIVSVDVGRTNKPSARTGKSFMESSEDEIAQEVWRQMVEDLRLDPDEVAEIVPMPRWYTLDRNLVFGEASGGRKQERRIIENRAPYLVPIVDDWHNRPGPEPWRPGGEPQPSRHLDRGVWQAGHGGSWVHFDSLVFAGTYLKTFTRLTTMESANESARHAVNGILDHWLYKNSGGHDRRSESGIKWLMPYGHTDDMHSDPVRQPTPIGDYCLIEDMEDNEIAKLVPIRKLDAEFCRAGLPHPFVLNGLQAGTAITSQLGALLSGGPYPKLPTGPELLDYLREYRNFLEDLLDGRPGRPHWNRHDRDRHDRDRPDRDRPDSDRRPDHRDDGGRGGRGSRDRDWDRYRGDRYGGRDRHDRGPYGFDPMRGLEELAPLLSRLFNGGL